MALIEAIAEAGSISAAARAMGMSYRRAWLLVDTLNRCFRDPVIETHAGQGARVTPLGHALTDAYHRLMASMQPAANDPDMATIENALRTEPLARTGDTTDCA